MKAILITIDSLRADHTLWHKYKRDTTPCLQEFAGSSCSLTNCFAAGTSTVTCIKGLMSSTYPLEFSADIALTDERPVIQHILQKQKIATAAVTANAFLSSHYDWNRGFSDFYDYGHSGHHSSKIDVYDFRRKIRNIVRRLGKFLPSLEVGVRVLDRFRQIRTSVTPYPNAQRIKDTAIQWLEMNHRKDFFLWLHFNEPHSPYISPQAYMRLYLNRSLSNLAAAFLMTKLEYNQRKISSKEIEILQSLYDAQIKFVDSQIGRLFDFLREAGIWDETLVIVTADHGEEFREHGEIGHGHLGGTSKLYDEIIHVPLLIKAPEQSVGREINMLVSHLDIVPTILEHFEISSDMHRGETLVPLLVGDEKSRKCKGVFSEFVSNGKRIISYRTEKHKYIHDERKGDEFYNLVSDPHEKRNICRDNRLGKEFRAIIDKHKQFLEKTHSPEAVKCKAREEDEELKQRLRDLGYM